MILLSSFVRSFFLMFEKNRMIKIHFLSSACEYYRMQLSSGSCRWTVNCGFGSEWAENVTAEYVTMIGFALAHQPSLEREQPLPAGSTRT